MASMKIALALACCAAQMTASSGQSAPAIAVRQTVAPDPGQPPITVAIWTPAALIGTGSAARKLPLIVISHGTGGGPISHADTARALAEAGFVVVAPMHPGDNFQDDQAVGRPNWLADRARHVTRVIDFMLRDWPEHTRIDANRIGIFGFSAGATTALIAIGGKPDLNRAATQCARAHEFVCDILKPQIAGNAAPIWPHDNRIRAAVIAAPGLGFAFEPSGLRKVSAPVQLWTGGEDQTVPEATNAAVVSRLLPNAPDLHRVEGAGHLSFLAPCEENTPPMLCQDKPGFDRAAFHQSFNQTVVAYFLDKLEH